VRALVRVRVLDPNQDAVHNHIQELVRALVRALDPNLNETHSPAFQLHELDRTDESSPNPNDLHLQPPSGLTQLNQPVERHPDSVQKQNPS
jgi:hypothetical protein